MGYGEELRKLMSGIYTEQELDRIKNACISISGVGGSAGSYLVDVLARKGFENFILSEPERYDTRNISRQLFANTATVGRPKLDVTVEHLLRINPEIKCRTFERVDVKTVEDTVKCATVVSYQAEGFSPWVLTNYMCSIYGLPFVNVSRKKRADNLRSVIATTVLDYRLPNIVFDIRQLDFESFGIPPELAKEVISMFESGDMDARLLEQADNVHTAFKKKKRFKNLGDLYPEVGDIQNRFPDDYFKRYTDPEICLIAGALGSRAITDLVVGRVTRVHELDIFSRGKPKGS